MSYKEVIATELAERNDLELSGWNQNAREDDNDLEEELAYILGE